ncbi:MAG: dihydrofolate reductase [Myxococcales bacterium]|nr:dihydrofolate reductase [Myxococcales bacterium]
MDAPLTSPADLPHGAADAEFDLVLAVDAQWGIGKDNALPWPKLSADLQHFQRLTSTAPPGRRNAVVMGRRTWESKEVGGRPLPRRCNVVLTSRSLVVPDGVLVASSLEDALTQLGRRAELGHIFVIGGAEIYRLALAHPRCRAVYLTRVAATFGADTFVPDLDALCEPDPSWPARTHREHDLEFRIEKLLVRPPRRT